MPKTTTKMSVWGLLVINKVLLHGAKWSTKFSLKTCFIPFHKSRGLILGFVTFVVESKMIWSGETPIANLALEWLWARVFPDVTCKLIRARESPLTTLEMTSVRLFSRVDTLMCFQMRTLCVGFATTWNRQVKTHISLSSSYHFSPKKFLFMNIYKVCRQKCMTAFDFS